MLTELKMVIAVVDKVSFDKVSCSRNIEGSKQEVTKVSLCKSDGKTWMCMHTFFKITFKYFSVEEELY